MMGNVDTYYWKFAICFFIVALAFLFITTGSLLKGKLKLPAWVFSSFTLALGIFFLKLFLNSLDEFSSGRHDTIDGFMSSVKAVARILNLS